MKTTLSVALCFLFVIHGCSQKNDQVSLPKKINFSLELIVPDLEIPWSFEFLPDRSILIAEKSGGLYIYKNNAKVNIKGMPAPYVRGQGGLLDLALHPNFINNKRIYFTQSSSVNSQDSGGNTALYTAILKDTSLQDVSLLYKAAPNTTSGRHFGSKIIFDRQGYLYFTIGDRGDRDVTPQNINLDGGKVYRLNDDGTIPADNPFVGTQGAKEAVYSYGHRNPQGMTLHPDSGHVWTHEHGPKGGDEINIIEAGKNYGWPIITYGKNYSGTTITEETQREGMEQPLYYWIPSIAPSGMAFVSSDRYPAWKGNLLVGSLKFSYLERLVIDNNNVTYREKIAEDIGRVRDVVQSPDGFIYISVESKGIYKIVPKV